MSCDPTDCQMLLDTYIGTYVTYLNNCYFLLSVRSKCGRVPDSFVDVLDIVQYRLEYMIDHISSVWNCDGDSSCFEDMKLLRSAVIYTK